MGQLIHIQWPHWNKDKLTYMYLNRVNITKVMCLKLDLIDNLALCPSNCTLKNNNSTDKLSNIIMLEHSGGSRKDKREGEMVLTVICQHCFVSTHIWFIYKERYIDTGLNTIKRQDWTLNTNTQPWNLQAYSFQWKSISQVADQNIKH